MHPPPSCVCSTSAAWEEYHILPQPSPPIMCVQYECCMGQFPFDAQNEGALIRKILKGAYAPIVGQYTANLVSNICQSMAAHSIAGWDSGFLVHKEGSFLARMCECMCPHFPSGPAGALTAHLQPPAAAALLIQV